MSGTVTFAMDRRQLLQLLSAGAGLGAAAPLFAGVGGTYPNAGGIDFADPAARLDAFIKVEGDTSGKEHFLYGFGSIFTFIDGQKDVKLFDTELLAARRYRRIDGGWVRLHREAGIYRDAESGDILERWYNPFIEREVVPINIMQEFSREYLVKDLGSKFNIGVTVHGGDVFMQRNFFISRPSDLPPREYPLHGYNETFDLSEYVNFFASLAEVADPGLSATQTVGTTNSVTGLLPWLELGKRPWLLVHMIRFKKLSSLDEVPADFVAKVRSENAKFLSAPTSYEPPDLNTTGEKFYQREIERRLQQR